MEVSGHLHELAAFPPRPSPPLPSHGERTPVPVGSVGPQRGSGRFVVPAGDSDKRQAIHERGRSSFVHVAIGSKDGCRREQG